MMIMLMLALAVCPAGSSGPLPNQSQAFNAEDLQQGHADGNTGNLQLVIQPGSQHPVFKLYCTLAPLRCHHQWRLGQHDCWQLICIKHVPLHMQKPGCLSCYAALRDHHRGQVSCKQLLRRAAWHTTSLPEMRQQHAQGINISRNERVLHTAEHHASSQAVLLASFVESAYINTPPLLLFCCCP
jgi:hypothetical protein